MQMLERRAEELQRIVPGLRRDALLLAVLQVRLRHGRRHLNEMHQVRLLLVDPVHEILQRPLALLRVPRSRLLPAGDPLPVLVQVLQLRELDLRARLQRHDLLDGLLGSRVLTPDLRQHLVMLDLCLRLRLPEHLVPVVIRPARQDPPDPHLQLHLPDLVPVPVPKVPPVRPRLPFQRHD